MQKLNIIRLKIMKKVIAGKFLILFIFPLLISCGSNFEDIKIGDPESVQVIGFEGNYLKMNVRLPVENPTSHKIRIQEIDLKVFLNGRYIGKLLVDEAIVIKPKRQHTYDLPVKVRLSNILNTAFIMMTLKEGQHVPVKFEGKIVARSMLMSRTIEISEERKIKI